MEGAGLGASTDCRTCLQLLLRQDTKALSELALLPDALTISYAWSSYCLINDTHGSSYSPGAGRLALCGVLRGVG